MITGTLEELNKIVETYFCPEHGKRLVVAWHAEEDNYVIRCGEGHYPEEVTREKTRIEQHKAGELQKVDPLFNLLPKTDLASGEVLTQAAIQFLVDYAERYALDAYRGHVGYMYGKPYIGLDGYLFFANRSRISYQLRSRPLDEDERKTYRIDENDHAWTCELILPLGDQSFTGLGVVTREELVAMSTRNPNKLRSPVVASHPWQLAQKRAEWQALRRAFPIGDPEKQQEAAGDL